MDIFVIEIVDADNVHMNLLKEFQKKEIQDIKKWNEHCFSYLMTDRILREFYHIEDREIVFENNKPKLKNGIKYFSISHNEDFVAIAFSDFNCSIAIEKTRELDFENYKKTYNFESSDNKEFFDKLAYKKAEFKLNDEVKSSKEYHFGEYTVCALSNNIDEEFEIYIQSGEVIPK